MTALSAYGGLFLAAFLAATVFPAQSEAVLVGMMATEAYPVHVLITVASAGNILGSVLNWALGRGIARFEGQKWFPVSEASLARGRHHYARYGRWSLLLSWVPFIGDPITVAAGIMKERFLPFLILVGIAKTGRYVFLAAVYLRYF